MPMSLFSDECPGCRPAVMDDKGTVLSDNHPLMQRINHAWLRTTLAQRQAFHRCTCLNSRDPLDLALVKAFLDSVDAPEPE
jgi:hypothetical protein